MAPPDTGPIWKQIFQETVSGRRGVVKTTSLWLPLGTIVSIDASEGREDGWIVCVLVFATVACWSVASVLANDLADKQTDDAAGKRRWIWRLPTGLSVLVVALLYGLGMWSLVRAGCGAGGVGAYLAATVLGLGYSVRPLCFKARGLWGLLAYGSAGTFAFAVIPWHCLGSSWRTLGVLAPAVLLDKWVSIHFHEVIDYAADRIGGIRTYPVIVGHEHARRSLKRVARLAAVWLMGTLVFVAFSVPTWRIAIAGAGVGVILGVALCAKIMLQRPDRASALLKELPGTYVGATYALFRGLPPVLFARLALLEPKMWAVFCIVALSITVEAWHVLRYHYH